MLLIDGRERDLGGGFLVRRILPFAKKRMVGPFVFLDHMGPLEIAPGQNTDVRPHPHIGLSTLTYLFEGRINHHDSLDQKATIVPGQVNWMTAGRGVSHSERSHPDDRSKAHRLHGLQFWVALPDGQEEIEPSFQHYESVPRIEASDYTVTVVAGQGFGLTSPVRVTSPLIFAEFQTAKACTIAVEIPGHFESAVYVVKGSAEIEGQQVTQYQMLALDPKELKSIQASAGTHFVIIGGEPFKTPRHIWWNLVSSRPERIEETKRQWREKTFPMVPGETDFIPLPEPPLPDKK